VIVPSKLFLKTTLAKGTEAPSVSVTKPLILVCAKALTEINSRKIKKKFLMKTWEVKMSNPLALKIYYFL
jgi:hypothetical protein